MTITSEFTKSLSLVILNEHPPQNGERDPSLDVSNIIKNHKNEVAFIDNSPCLITPLNRKILQK